MNPNRFQETGPGYTFNSRRAGWVNFVIMGDNIGLNDALRLKFIVVSEHFPTNSNVV
jgi:hypothetical protein